jgi:hypothetical protein
MEKKFRCTPRRAVIYGGKRGIILLQLNDQLIAKKSISPFTIPEKACVIRESRFARKATSFYRV